MVMKPTHGFKILDVFLSNLHRFYDEPTILPPIVPDRPDKGKPSNHSGVSATPLSNTKQLKKCKTKQFIRPLPESLIEVFGTKLENESWDFLSPTLSSNQMVDQLQSYFKFAVESTFPLKLITVAADDKPWFNETLRQLKRKKTKTLFQARQEPSLSEGETEV